MAVPRIFISSTCYDLQEIRFQLRHFINDIGYEPVMSEFGDIFYDLRQHVQDACKEEIVRSNIFLLIVGNNYGSIYHKHISEPKLPDSVTLQEFRKALEVGIPKYIFINRFVQHDFENYRRILSKDISKYFSENDVADTEIEKIKSMVKVKFDQTYPFPQEAYRYVFYFLDIIYNLDINNAIYPFESFENIKDSLRKQWAGYFYDALTKERTVALEEIQKIDGRLEKIEKQLRLLAEGSKVSNDKGQLIINIDKLTNELDLENLEALQDKIHSIITSILYDDYLNPRITIKEMFDEKTALQFLKDLSEVVKTFKWSKFVPVTEIIKRVGFRYWKNRSDILYKDCMTLDGIAKSLDDEDRALLSNTIAVKFNELYEPEPESPPEPPDDDIPF